MRAGACVLALAVALLTPAAALAESPLAIRNAEALEVKPQLNKNSAEGVLVVLNSGAADRRVAVQLQAKTSARVDCRGSGTVPAEHASRITVECTGLNGLRDSVSGQLVVSADDLAPIAQTVKIVAPVNSARWAYRAIRTGAVVAGGVLLLIILIVVLNGKGGNLVGPAPGPEWKFSDSWATTLTTAGALFGTVLTGVTFPEAPERIDKDTLIFLNLLFGGAVVVAPFLFQAVRKPWVDPNEGALWGFNWMLLLTMGLTLGAVVGEIYALDLLGKELITSDTQGTAVDVASLVLIVAAVLYFCVTAGWAAATDWTKKVAASKPSATEVDVRDISRLGIVPPTLAGTQVPGAEATVPAGDVSAGLSARPFLVDVREADRLVIVDRAASAGAVPLRWTLP